MDTSRVSFNSDSTLFVSDDTPDPGPFAFDGVIVASAGGEVAALSAIDSMGLQLLIASSMTLDAAVVTVSDTL